jgi:hypothetical protein
VAKISAASQPHIHPKSVPAFHFCRLTPRLDVLCF